MAAGPLGRVAEDGVLDPVYRLTETDHPGYRRRTIWNVRDSDATLIINTGELEGGTLETERAARRLGKPCLLVQVDTEPAEIVDCRVRSWFNATPIKRLNIAGPRASKRPEIYDLTFALLDRVLGTTLSHARNVTHKCGDRDGYSSPPFRS
jgi:hypothetical protein